MRLPASLFACDHFRDGLRGGRGFVVSRSLVLCELAVMDVYAPRAGYGEPFGLKAAVQLPEPVGERRRWGRFSLSGVCWGVSPAYSTLAAAETVPGGGRSLKQPQNYGRRGARKTPHEAASIAAVKADI